MKLLFSLCLAAAAMVLPQAVRAEQAVDAGVVRACFDSAGAGETAPACLGQASEGCQIPGYEDNAGIMACIEAETAVWDDLLNDQYQYLMRYYRARGAQLQNALRDAQRAWIAYRDAECRLEYDRWGEGSLRVIVGANCRMIETAERALELRDKKEF